MIGNRPIAQAVVSHINWYEGLVWVTLEDRSVCLYVEEFMACNAIPELVMVVEIVYQQIAEMFSLYGLPPSRKTHWKRDGL